VTAAIDLDMPMLLDDHKPVVSHRSAETMSG
jgi:hypothetical protein